MRFILALAALLCFAGTRYFDRYGRRDLEVTFFDVGQGDGALVRFPGGKSLLIDGGGGFGEWDVGSRELVPELARLGILSLDWVALSHPDQDHGFGLLGVLKTIEAKELWYHASFSEESKPKPLMVSLLELAREKKIKPVPLRNTDRQFISGVGVERIAVKGGEKSNNRPLVLILDFAGCRIFFGGDMELPAESALSRSLSSITLLKVSHHGSKTSTSDDFLQRTKPKIAVVSVGRENRYGHPNLGVLSRLRRFNSQILRTDFHGFVRFRFNRDGSYVCDSAQGFCGSGTCRGQRF